MFSEVKFTSVKMEQCNTDLVLGQPVGDKRHQELLQLTGLSRRMEDNKEAPRPGLLT